jgi:hypothetical protein
MKTITLKKITALLAAALLTAGLTTTATAGPGPMTTFKAVKSEKEAANLKVGTQIATTCDQCHGVSVATVNNERTYLHGYTCPACKLKFTTIMPGGGGRGTIGSFSYSDAAGHTAHLAAAR